MKWSRYKTGRLAVLTSTQGDFHFAVFSVHFSVGSQDKYSQSHSPHSPLQTHMLINQLTLTACLTDGPTIKTGRLHTYCTSKRSLSPPASSFYWDNSSSMNLLHTQILRTESHQIHVERKHVFKLSLPSGSSSLIGFILIALSGKNKVMAAVTQARFLVQSKTIHMTGLL